MKMLKIFNMSRCTLCTMASTQSATRTFNLHETASNFEEIKATIKYEQVSKSCKSKRILVRASQENIKAVKSILMKYNVDMSKLENDKRIFNETQWNVEKRIMLLRELGLQNVTTTHILNFTANIFLPVPLYKAHFGLDPKVNLAENLLSHVQSSKIDPKSLNHLDEQKLDMKVYYSECLSYFLKQELELTSDQVRRIGYKKYTPLLYNSFTLLQRLLKLLREDWKFSKTLILKNYYWMLGHHPDHALAVIQMIQENYPDINIYKLILRYPKVLNYDIYDLRVLLGHMKHYKITTQMIHSVSAIFHLTPDQFKNRVESLLKNPFTLVFQKHPRFLLLVNNYQVTLPRIKYLQEKNLKHATIQSLTTFHNYIEELTCTRKLNKPNLMSFLELHFGNDADELFKQLKRHSYYQCVPLVQMYESLVYLREIYNKAAIYKHIYAILYTKDDLKAARKEILKNPKYRDLSPENMLSMCIYKIESIGHFTGNIVLSPNKYANSLKENANQEVKEVKEEEEEEESKDK